MINHSNSKKIPKEAHKPAMQPKSCSITPSQQPHFGVYLGCGWCRLLGQKELIRFTNLLKLMYSGRQNIAYKLKEKTSQVADANEQQKSWETLTSRDEAGKCERVRQTASKLVVLRAPKQSPPDTW